MKKVFLLPLFLLGIMVTSCSQQQARRPISHSSGTFMKESIERNIKLVASEESQIDSIIKSNPHIKYIASDKGYWYHYEIENTQDTIKPKRGDVAFFNYEIKDIKGNLIYSEVELRPQVYYVDKQNIMMGLRDGIKLMNEGEKITFLFPSHMGYGYHGDNNRIGTNQPLICTVTLTDIKPENEVKEN
ncbi:gliding motility-associated peptidyl-prolyl isomerase GldI [Flavobacterium sp. NRK1]|jgi:gliding motility-associated peptidyl-prolyl isomerase|uniref:gliding motility-associated peptidyl-prolyl isomerase GldI n=1 Tax=Flavobacterium sp. NRK1 TaxID=2954929 RepID=UPI0020921DB4|nr:gliding motility-associated peptidyl-prolyl isomerase GldI [Flavobacterium sp. NRK1]MCO6146612.1 gliding motility-associated peptidyl-prolyl isomerase GldI [Flavobacterium sp. NRK1]